MKKQRKRAKAASSQVAPKRRASATDSTASVSRRGLLVKARNYGLAVAVIGGGLWIGASNFQEALAEGDLSRIGDGIPTVVQIHDPQCSQCLALQKEARAALVSFSDGEIKYVVANIRQPEGRDFAARHGVAHVTLMIFNGDGERKLTLRGHNGRERLRSIFSRHATKPPAQKPAPAPQEAAPEGPPTS